MSIIHSFDPSEEILRPDHLAPPVEGFPETVIVTFKQKIIDLLKARCDTEEISSVNAVVKIPIYKFTYNGHTLGAYLTMLGGAAATGILEEVFAKGAKRILFFGSCGALDSVLTAGRLIVPTAAYRDEGTSYHYLPAGDYVDIPTAPRLASIFDALHIPYVTGKTWTTDAIYRETRRNMEARRAEGCLTVEMECASVMAAGQFRGRDVYQFLYAEDSLAGDTWDPRTMGNVPASAIEGYLRIALETAIRL